MPPPKQQRRRALELLEASIDGCTEAIMLAYGFKTELLVELVNAGLATATIDRMVVGGRRVKVIRMRITAAGRPGAREASMALIPKRASASRHRYHSDPAILRYAALQSAGTSRAFLVTRTAGADLPPPLQNVRRRAHQCARDRKQHLYRVASVVA